MPKQKVRFAINALRVVWIPQLGGSTFYTHVESVDEGVRVMDLLAAYDLFQYEHKIKPDYANMGFLERYTSDGWESWFSDCEEYDNPREYLESLGDLKNVVVYSKPEHGPLHGK